MRDQSTISTWDSTKVRWLEILVRVVVHPAQTGLSTSPRAVFRPLLALALAAPGVIWR
jgi:hypothetical protein